MARLPLVVGMGGEQLTPSLQARRGGGRLEGMAPSARKLVVPVLLALAGTALLAWLGLATASFTDYELEAEPALAALRNGDLQGFLARLPAYGGSLILRSPFALAPDLWHGGDLALFRSMAAPCLAAGAALGVLLWARARKARLPRSAAYLALALCTVNPITLRALETGHPEELLGGALCVAAALAALARRPVPAGVLLGLAVANKPWAVLAVVPVMLMLGRGHVRALVAAGAVATVLIAPMVLGGAAGVQAAGRVAGDTGEIFQPWQVWWFAGEHGHVVRGLTAEKPGYRVPPPWISGVGHPIVILLGLLLSLACMRRLRARPHEEALLLLAVVLVLRCLLDPWNITYYALPFLLALAAWEVVGSERAPLLALAATVMTWVSFEQLPQLLSPDAQAAAYLAWSVPLAVVLTWRVLDPRGSRRAARRAAVALRRLLPTLLAAGDGAASAGRPKADTARGR